MTPDPDRPLRILQVSDFFPPVVGGLEHHVSALATALAARGHDVHVATMTKNAQADDPSVTIHPVDAVAVQRLPHIDATRPFHPPLPDPTARHHLRRIIAMIKPDVVHGHSWLALSLPRTSGVPLVFTAHDYGIACARRTMLFRDEKVCTGPGVVKCARCLHDHLGVATSVLLSAGTPVGRSLLRPDASIVVSSAVQSRLRKWLPEAQVIGNFVRSATTATPSAHLAPQPTAPFVMFGGDPSTHKGFRVLLSCWQGRDPIDAPLVVASSRWSEMPLPSHVHVRFVPHAAMPEAWAAAAMAVVPSIWPDPAPTVALEAMSAGIPVVASRIGGLPELVRDEVEGLLVDPGDVGQLKAAIRRLLADETLRLRLGAAGRERSARFSAENIVPHIESVYRDVIGKAVPRRATVRGPGAS